MTDEEETTPEFARKLHRIKVGNDTEPRKLGWAIYKFYQEGKLPVLVGIGVAAAGQAMKAVAVANGHLAPSGVIFDVFPHFGTVEEEHVNGGDMRALVLDLRERKL